MFKFFKKKKEKITNMSTALNSHVDTIKSDTSNTFVFVKFIHRDKKITFHSCKLNGQVIEIGDVAYYIGEDSISFFNYESNNEKYQIAMVDIYEGITAGYNPYEDRLLEIYNEKLQKAIYLHLKTGIMEHKLQSKMTMRNIIILGLMGIAAVVIIFKMMV